MKRDDFVEAINQNFIQLNPEIVQLSIPPHQIPKFIPLTGTFLKFLSKTLAKLNTLRLDNVKIIEDEYVRHIHFPHVYGLILRTAQHPDNTSITFGKLKHLQVNKVLDESKWMDFVVQNKHVTRLYSIESKIDINVVDLIQFVTGLPILKQIEFSSSSLLPADLIQFLKTCEPIYNLKTIGHVIWKRKLQNKISEIENLMDDDFRSHFSDPVVKDFAGSKGWIIIEFCRKSN